MATTRLPREWREIKKIGDVEPVRILVHKETGKFGTTIDSEHIKQHDTLVQAEQFVKAMQSEGAIDALLIDSSYSAYNDAPIRLTPTRLRWVGRDWVRMDGNRLGYQTPYQPDPVIQQAVEAKRAEHAALLKQAAALRDEIGDMARSLKKLEAPGE